MTGKFHVAVVFNIDQAVVVFAWKEAKIEDLKGCCCKAEEHLESKISVRRRAKRSIMSLKRSTWEVTKSFISQKLI